MATPLDNFDVEDARLKALIDDFRDKSETASGAEEVYRANDTEYFKQKTALFERVLLVDLGAIALSVSTIVTLSGKLHAIQGSLHIFVAAAVISAWIFLLIAGSCSYFGMTESMNFLDISMRRSSSQLELDHLKHQLSSLALMPLQPGYASLPLFLKAFHQELDRVKHELEEMNKMVAQLYADMLIAKKRLERFDTWAIAMTGLGFMGFCAVGIVFILAL